ncbi:MAG: hypothetical protein IKL57_07460 [Oscillospiraceae bacterium]|nr:hypothetical protein [Oscillospiraceae bacterium]
MKKVSAFILALTVLFSFVGCGNTEKAKNEQEKSSVVGIWQNTSEDLDGYMYNKVYMYVYESKTGDAYFMRESDEHGNHWNSFVWDIEEEYFVKELSVFGSTSIVKYKIGEDVLYDNQNNVAYVKVSDDPTVDIEITP